jgi:hypothetical protein
MLLLLGYYYAWLPHLRVKYGQVLWDLEPSRSAAIYVTNQNKYKSLGRKIWSGPETKNDYAGEGQMQITRPDRMAVGG